MRSVATRFAVVVGVPQADGLRAELLAPVVGDPLAFAGTLVPSRLAHHGRAREWERGRFEGHRGRREVAMGVELLLEEGSETQGVARLAHAFAGAGHQAFELLHGQLGPGGPFRRFHQEGLVQGPEGGPEAMADVVGAAHVGG